MVKTGLALEVADAPLLHAGLNLADIAHVMVLLEQRLIPGDSAQRLLRLLLEVNGMPAADFPMTRRTGILTTAAGRRDCRRGKGGLAGGRARRHGHPLCARPDHPVSAAPLCCAARGQAAEVVSVLRAFEGREPAGPAVARLLAAGHTSGADLAWGLAAGCAAVLALPA